jgi:GAF domain
MADQVGRRGINGKRGNGSARGRIGLQTPRRRRGRRQWAQIAAIRRRSGERVKSTHRGLWGRAAYETGPIGRPSQAVKALAPPGWQVAPIPAGRYLPCCQIGATLRFPNSVVESGLMSSRSRRAGSKPPAEPSGEPAREALLAALAERERELAEAIAQQAAASEVLQIINVSEGDLAPVFEAIVERAMRLCGAPSGGMWLLDGDRARPVGARNLPVAYLEFLNREPVSPSQVFGRTVQERPFLQIADLSATEAYRNRVPLTVASVELGSIRTYLGVPLREGGAVVGIINLLRQEVRPFTDRQIALVQSFAIQAEIAMMNARHINETQEALARQTATSEILRVISQSPTDARPVFERIVVTAARLLRCDMAFVLLREGDAYVHTAGATPEGPMADLALSGSRSIRAPTFLRARSSPRRCCTCRTGRSSTCPSTSAASTRPSA